LLGSPVMQIKDYGFEESFLRIAHHLNAPVNLHEKKRGVTLFAQFIAVCSSSILVETLGNAASFSSPWRGKQRVFERRKPVLMDQLQPSTNSDKLSVGVYPHCNPLRTSRGAGG